MVDIQKITDFNLTKKIAILARIATVLIAASSVMPIDARAGKYYEITSGTSKGYIIGSMHVGTKNIYPLDDRFQDLVKNANAIAFEVPPKPTGAWTNRLFSSLRLASRSEFRALIAMNIYNESMEILLRQKDLSMNVVSQIQDFHPYILYQLLARSVPVNAGTSIGMESTLMEMAEKSGVKIVELEDPLELTRSVKDLTTEETNVMISTMLRLVKNKSDRDDNQNHLEKISVLVQTGDFKAVREQNEDFAIQKFHWTKNMFNKLYYSRNGKLAESVIGMFKSGSTFIAVIGASHLSGEEGIIAVLRKNNVAVVEH